MLCGRDLRDSGFDCLAGFLEIVGHQLRPQRDESDAEDDCRRENRLVEIEPEVEALRKRQHPEATDDRQLHVLAVEVESSERIGVVEVDRPQPMSGVERELRDHRHREAGDQERENDLVRTPAARERLCRFGRTAPQSVPAYCQDGKGASRAVLVETDEIRDVARNPEYRLEAGGVADHLVDEEKDEGEAEEAEHHFDGRKCLRQPPEEVVADGRKDDMSAGDWGGPVPKRQVAVTEFRQGGERHVDGNPEAHEYAREPEVEECRHFCPLSRNGVRTDLR